MENFSTPRQAHLPWIANLVTLAVVLAAIGWSGEQRPASPAPTSSATVPAVAQTAPSGHSPATQAGSMQDRWPAETTTRPIDGLQAVGYSPRQLP